MALSDKDIIITPNKSQTADPRIEFRGADSSTGPQTITVRAYPTNGGTLSFEGSSGQLFAITNSLTGTLFSVNDGSGVPSIEVLDTGNIRLAQYSGNVGIGTGTPTAELHVAYATAQTSVDGTAQLLTLENAATTDASGNLAGIRFRQTNSTNSANGFVGMASTGSSTTRGSLIFAPPNTSGNATEKMRLTVYGTLLVGDTVEINSSWWNNGIGVFGKNGTDKLMVGYLASSTTGALVGAHNSALNAWAPLNVSGSTLNFRIGETSRMFIDASGNITTGVWNATVINSTYGGTGVNNGGRTLTLNTNSGTITFSNASTTLTVANTASVSGTNTGDQTTVSGNAGTATTWQTARTLTIGATGKSVNGSADVSWTVAEIQAAAGTPSAQSLNFDTIKIPGLYQYDGTIGATKPPDGSPNYRTIEIGNSQRYTQIALPWDSDNMYFRRQNSVGWQTWRTVIHDGNYNSYAPTLTGTGASGTWGISITGNAATATTASNVNNGTLTLAVSGSGLSGSASFTANQSTAATFTVTSNATVNNTASTIVYRGTSSEVYVGDAYSSGWWRSYGYAGIYNQDYGQHFYAGDTGYYNLAGNGTLTYGGLRFRANHQSTVKGLVYWDADGFGLLNQGGNWAVRINAASGYAGGSLYGVWDKRNASNTGTSVAIPGMFVQAGSTGAPSAIQNGDLWWNTETGKLKIWYSTSSAWVDATSVPDLANYFPVAGGNITGNVSIGGLLNTTGNITTRNGQTHSLSLGQHPSYGTSWAGVWRTGSDYALITNSSDTLVNAPTGSVGFRVANTQYAHVATDGVHTSYWFRNDANNTGLYNTNTTQHLSSQANGYWDMSSTTTVSAIRLYTGGHLTALRGYVYANTSNDIGFLEPGGGWRLRIVGGDYLQGDGSSIRGQIFYDSNDTAYFIDPSSGQADNQGGKIKWNFTVNGEGAGTGRGLGLYPSYSSNVPTYGITFAQTVNLGTHGNVTSDWATYFTMNSTANRGWVFRDVSTPANVASISNAGRMRIASLGVNTDASATNGEIRATDNITAYYSDERLKTRLGAIENPIEKVKSLSGFYFEANETAVALGYQKKREVGVSAQEVQAILPEIIAPAPIDDKYMTVRYEKLIPLLIEAIKAQQSQIEELQKLIEKKV